MENFVFVKKSKAYRLALYYMIWAVLLFHAVLFILNLAIINKNSNVGLVIFNSVFILTMAFVVYKHVLPKYKYKVTKADYQSLVIKDNILVVKYKDTAKAYNFNNQGDYVTQIKFVPRITGSIDSVSRLSYNVNFKLSDGKSVIALLSYKKAGDLVDAIPNKTLVEKLEKQLKDDQEFYVSSHKKIARNIPSIICFSIASFTLLYTLIIVFGYSTTSGTYYATELMTTNPRAPVNSFKYEVQSINYANTEDYTISFGDNLNKQITVFYRESNPSDSYTMYTVDFLGFITGTLFIIGGILLNNKFSHYLAVLGLSVMPFYLIRLLNISVSTMFSTHILIPVLSLLSIPTYLLLSGILKLGTDVSKLSKEKRLM